MVTSRMVLGMMYSASNRGRNWQLFGMARRLAGARGSLNVLVTGRSHEEHICCFCLSYEYSPSNYVFIRSCDVDDYRPWHLAGRLSFAGVSLNIDDFRVYLLLYFKYIYLVFSLSFYFSESRRSATDPSSFESKHK